MADNWTPRTLTAAELEVGDLVVGPSYFVVRIAAITPEDGNRFDIKHTDPDAQTDREYVADSAEASRGYPADREFVVLARGIPKAAVQAWSMSSE